MATRHRRHRHRDDTDDIELGQSMHELPLESDRTFGQRLAAVGLLDVFYHPKRDERECIINLPNLHRMMLHTFQRDLVEEVSKIRDKKTMSSDQTKRIRTALSTYASAIRDWELMVKYSVKAGAHGSQGPFILTSNKPLDLWLMSEANLIPSDDLDAKRRLEAFDAEDAILPPIDSRTRLYYNQEEKHKAFLERFYMAIFGGVVLVGPMLLMVLYKHLLTSLLTVSIAVFAFALAMAVFSTETPETVLTAVAAYAAVLVVFVGASS